MQTYFPLFVRDYFYLVDRFTEADYQAVLQVRRLIERFNGDAEFRGALAAAPSCRDEVLAGVGLALRASDVNPLFDVITQGSLSTADVVRFDGFPVLRTFMAWAEILKDASARYERWQPQTNLRFFRWRIRELHAVGREVGTLDQTSSTPPIMFELSKGCSVGCWFCAGSAERLQGVFEYTPEHAALWQAVLHESNVLFGRSTSTSALYHATEPFDNPDYVKFLKDFYAEFAFYPQTTTALPLKHLNLTREILALRRDCPVIPDRFSILTVGMLRKIHETFSVEDLKYVELVLHAKGALSRRSNAGRARDHFDKLRRSNAQWEALHKQSAIEQTSSECVCGFLVNMVDRSIQLITPCVASDRWPLGTRILAAGIFEDASSFRAFIEDAIKEHMPEELAGHDRLAFREGLHYEPLAEGFAISARFFRHVLSGQHYMSRLGQLIARGDLTKDRLIDIAVSEGAPIFEIMKTLQLLFDRGFLIDRDCYEHESDLPKIR